MARLLPPDPEMSDVVDGAERNVVRRLVQELDDSWTVVPNVRIKVDNKDSEIDVIVADPTRGAVLLEIKGGVVTVEDGIWYQYGKKMRRQPDTQIMRAKHALVKRLRQMGIDLENVELADAVCLPAVRNVPDSGIGSALPRERIIDGTLLDDPGPAFEALLPDHTPVPLPLFEKFLSALKPTIVLDGRDSRASPAAMRLLDSATSQHLDALRALGDHSRVVVTGGPGTGKTWLVLDWARRAAERGERAAVICFNKPISRQLAHALDDLDLIVATYHSMIMDHLLDHIDFEPPTDSGTEYWDHVPTRILTENLDQITERFDTFIVDEGQDLRPHWLDSLEALLDPAGPKRILMTLDPEQGLYVDSDVWRGPDGAVELPLLTNVRACRHVAEVIEHLGGPGPLDGAPAGMRTALLPSGPRQTTKSVVKRVRELVDDYGVPHSEILVVTINRKWRDAVLAAGNDSVSFVSWENRAEGEVVCETIHRSKGLEATAVILVAPDDDPDERLIYVGASRASWSLSLVGPPSLGELTGVTTN